MSVSHIIVLRNCKSPHVLDNLARMRDTVLHSLAATQRL